MSELANKMNETVEGIKAANTALSEQISQAIEAGLYADGEPEITPFDQSCIDLMDRVAAFFGECASNPDFCGLSVDELRDVDGNLLSLRLVPCDMVGEDAVRRVGR